MTEEDLSVEKKVTTKFKCRDCQIPPIDFKGIDVIQDGSKITLSQTPYADKMTSTDLNLESRTKPELTRPLNDVEVKIIRSDVGKLACLATGTFPLASVQASVALQGRKDSQKTLQTLVDTRNIFLSIRNKNLTSIFYSFLDLDSIHIRLYTDGAFQNLQTKHSQLGFVIALCDVENKFNLIHWHSARTPRRPCSTEESEVMSLASDIKFVHN